MHVLSKLSVAFALAVSVSTAVKFDDYQDPYSAAGDNGSLGPGSSRNGDLPIMNNSPPPSDLDMKPKMKGVTLGQDEIVAPVPLNVTPGSMALQDQTAAGQGNAPKSSGNKPVLPVLETYPSEQGNAPVSSENGSVLPVLETYPSNEEFAQGNTPGSSENGSILPVLETYPSNDESEQSSTPDSLGNDSTLPVFETNPSNGESEQDNQPSPSGDGSVLPVLETYPGNDEASSEDSTSQSPDSSITDMANYPADMETGTIEVVDSIVDQDADTGDTEPTPKVEELDTSEPKDETMDGDTNPFNNEAGAQEDPDQPCEDDLVQQPDVISPKAVDVKGGNDEHVPAPSPKKGPDVSVQESSPEPAHEDVTIVRVRTTTTIFVTEYRQPTPAPAPSPAAAFHNSEADSAPVIDLVADHGAPVDAPPAEPACVPETVYVTQQQTIYVTMPPSPTPPPVTPDNIELY